MLTKISLSVITSLSCYQNVNEHLIIRLSKCQRTSRYPVIKMSTNISLSRYQNINEHLIIRLSKCQRTSHYPVIKMPTNISLSLWRCSDQQMRFNKYFLNQYVNWLSIASKTWHITTNLNVKENITIRLSTCRGTSHYPVIKMSTNISIRLSKCQRTSHYPVIKMSANISLSAYPNVNENISLSDYQNAHEHLTITMTLFWPSNEI